MINQPTCDGDHNSNSFDPKLTGRHSGGSRVDFSQKVQEILCENELVDPDFEKGPKITHLGGVGAMPTPNAKCSSKRLAGVAG